MSNLILGPVWKMRLKSSPKFVAVSLADQANDDGYCWPGINSISRRTGISTRTVQEAIRYLEQIRLIKVVERPGKSNGYQFNMEFIRNAELFDGVDTAADESQGVRNSQGCEIRRGANTAPRGAKSAGEGCESRTQTINNHQEPSGGSAPAREPEKPKAKSIIPLDWQPAPATLTRCKDAGYPDADPGQIAAFIAHHRATENRFKPEAIEDAFVSWMAKADRFGAKGGGAQPIGTASRPPAMPNFHAMNRLALAEVHAPRVGVDPDKFADKDDLATAVERAWRRENGVSA